MDFRAIRQYSSARESDHQNSEETSTMKRTLLGALLALIATSQVVPQTRPAAGSPPAAAATTAGSSEQAKATIGTYCTTCHSSQAKMGGLALDNLNVDAVGNDA